MTFDDKPTANMKTDIPAAHPRLPHLGGMVSLLNSRGVECLEMDGALTARIVLAADTRAWRERLAPLKAHHFAQHPVASLGYRELAERG